MNLKEFLELGIEIGNSKITVSSLLIALLVLGVARFIVWLVNGILLEKYFIRKGIDTGRQLALKQFISYIIWVLAVLAILEMLGISSMIWASSAALMVGIGLGLQDTFKDLISGVVILIEGIVEVGDVVEIGGTVAQVTAIGLRTSKVETRDRMNIIIPNSKLVVDSIINWSHNDFPTRFSIKVGVAYGSDLSLVKTLLLKAARENTNVLPDPPPSVQFKNFGDSSLDFELYFFSNEFFRIEIVKSDIRLEVDRLFRENDVQIPFPQRDLWLRNPEKLRGA